MAVQQGIWDCLKRRTEAPVKSAKANFGLAAFQRWADALTAPKDKQSWAKVFPPGIPMYAGLASAFSLFELGAVNARSDHGLYADFLEEAALVLERPALREAAGHFRAGGEAWGRLAETLLPGSVAPFKETRELLLRRRQAFVERGGESLAERQAIDERLAAIRAEMQVAFPLTASESAALRERIREQVLKTGELERTAHDSLQAVMAGKPGGQAANAAQRPARAYRPK